MKINAVCLTFILFLASCQEATVPFFANEESVKRELENDFICDEIARANQPYANSGSVSGVGSRQAFNICTTEQFLNIGKRKQDWDKYFNIRADLNFKEELLLVEEDFFPLGEITFYNDFEAPDEPENTKNNRLAFTGVIDGKGHSIMRLSVLFEEYNKRSIGIFPYIASPGEIRNLNFEGIRIIHSRGDDFISDSDGSFLPTFSGGVVGLSDGARFENVHASKIQLIHELNTKANSTGIFSGLLVNTIVNNFSLYAIQSASPGFFNGGFTGAALGGRFTDIDLSIPSISFDESLGSLTGGFSGVLEGNDLDRLDYLIDAPIELVRINGLKMKLLEDQSSLFFGGVSLFAHDVSIENVEIETKKIEKLKTSSGVLFGIAEKVEVNDIKLTLGGDLLGDVDEDVDNLIVGVMFGYLDNSNVQDLSVDLNLKKINFKSISKVGVIGGQIKNSSLKNINIYNGSTLSGYKYVGGLAGELIDSSINNASLIVGVIQSNGNYDHLSIEPPDGSVCYTPAFLGGAVGLMSGNSHLKNVNVMAETIRPSSSKAAAVGGLVGANFGNIDNSSAKTKIVSGAHYVGGLVGINYSNGVYGNIKRSRVENSEYISGWKAVGGIVGASGVEYNGDWSKPFCYSDVELEDGVNHLGGELLYNSAEINNMYAFEKIGGALGEGYEAKVNSSFVKVSGTLGKWKDYLVDENDHKPDPPYIINEMSLGGFIGKAHMSSVRNSYVSTQNTEALTIDGVSSVGGFVGESLESQFFYNFSDTNTYGKHANLGFCEGNESATSKAECEFSCKRSDIVIDLPFHRSSSCESPSLSDDWRENIKAFAELAYSSGLSNVIKVNKPEGADEIKCQDILGDEVEGINSMSNCLSTFSCLKADGTIDSNLVSRESCVSMGYCGGAEAGLLYDNINNADEPGYVNERDCCINGEKVFLSNKWVRNYWMTEVSDHSYESDDSVWTRTDDHWTEGSVTEETKVPSVGKFAGKVDLTFDNGSNSIELDSFFHENYSKGECLNPNTSLVQSEFGEGVAEGSTDDSDFYVCNGNDIDGGDDTILKNQMSCNRLGTCNPDGLTKTRGDCLATSSGTPSWAVFTWGPKSGGDLGTGFGSPESCVDLNLKNVKEKINVSLSREDKENLDTCNDSIIKQLGRQDQVLFSKEQYEADYFNYSFNPPLNYWNFNYFWEEVENDVPVLFR